eukprot:gene5405-5638_t
MAPAAAVLSVQDAHAYVGKMFWKISSETAIWYQGIVQGVDTAIENEHGEITEGIFFWVLYPHDGGQERISWPELAMLLESPQHWTGKKRSNSSLLSPAGTAAIEGQHRSHHQQSQQRPQEKQKDAEQELPDKGRQCSSWGRAADEGVSEGAAAERTGTSRGSAQGGKRKRTALPQWQQQPARDTSKSGMEKPVRGHSLQQQMQRDSADAQDGDSPALQSSPHDELSMDAEGAEDAEEGSQEPDAGMMERLLQEATNQVVTVRTKGLAGQLKQVHVQNFLNHQNFIIEFSPHVNVISGKNGSGKSATLLAMQCCLGARAHATGRGESIKPFILTGAHEANLKVSLWNTGEDAYQPEVLGDHLTVERVIRLSGAQQNLVTKWRLLDHAGRKVSESKKAIDDMLDHLSISAANPLADTSRNFLCGVLADRKKYELFMEATCLADMQGNLDNLQRHVDEMQVIIKDIKAEHKKCQQKVWEVKEKLKKLESTAGLRDQRQMYERAAMWAAVEHLQAMLQKHTEVNQVKGPERLQAVMAWLDQINRKLDLARQREEQLNAANADLQANKIAFAARSHSNAEQLKQARLEHRRKDKAFKIIESQLKAVQEEMKELMEVNIQSNLHELRELQAAKNQKLAMFGRHAQLRAAVDKQGQLFERLPIGPIGAHLSLTQQVWVVAAEIVLGPHLEKWIVHNEQDHKALLQLARSLHMRDPVVLVSSFDRPAYNIRPNQKLQGDWQGLRQFVKIEHPEHPHIIDNKLMDMAHYDIVVVDQDEGRCKKLLYDFNTNLAGVAVSLAVHVSGMRWARKGKTVSTIIYYADRRPRINTSKESSVFTLQQLVQDQQAQLNVLQQQLAQADKDLHILQLQAEQTRKAARRSMAVKSRANQKVQLLQMEMPVYEAVEEDGDNMMAEAQRNLQQQLEVLRPAYDKAQAELQKATRTQDQAQRLHDAQRGEMEEMIEQMSNRTDELHQVAQAIQNLTSQKQKAAEERQLTEQKIEQARQAVAVGRQQLQSAKVEALKLGTEEECGTALARARQATKRALEDQIQRRRNVPAGGYTDQQLAEAVQRAYQDQAIDKATQYFTKQAADKDKQIASAEQEAGGSKQAVETQLQQAECKFQRLDGRVRGVIKVVNFCTRVVGERWGRYRCLHDEVVTAVSQKFMAYMHRRGHQGKVRIYQDRGELKLLVKVNSQSGGVEQRVKAVKDLKQLSGGERSFTTVSFVLALGEYTESPFRAMDEFDVFMDPIQRRCAIQTLLEFALEKGHLQFVLLTPQDLQVVEVAQKKLAEDSGKPLPKGFLKVVRLPDPARA